MYDVVANAAAILASFQSDWPSLLHSVAPPSKMIRERADGLPARGRRPAMRCARDFTARRRFTLRSSSIAAFREAHALGAFKASNASEMAHTIPAKYTDILRSRRDSAMSRQIPAMPVLFSTCHASFPASSSRRRCGDCRAFGLDAGEVAGYHPSVYACTHRRRCQKL